MLNLHFLRVLQYLGERTHVVIVGVGYEPRLNLIAQRANETSQRVSLFGKSAVHDYYLAFCGLKNIRIANGVAVAWYLPERKARLLFGVPCLGNIARCLCAGIAYSHCSDKHGGIFKEFSSCCHIHKVCLRLVISAKISLNFLSQPITCRRSSAYFANFATKT